MLSNKRQGEYFMVDTKYDTKYNINKRDLYVKMGKTINKNMFFIKRSSV